jgi:hypothetical protein
VYFADQAGSIGHVNVSEPGGCALIVQHMGEIRGLALDDDALYVNARVDGMSGTSAMSELWRFAL